MTSLLAGIPVLLNFDYLRNREAFIPLEKTIFTGPIDEFFNFDAGKLSYRGQRRVHEYFPDAQFLQPCGQVNNPSPSNGPHIRSLEWKHMMPKEAAERITGTVITQEITESPTDPSQYEYPFPDDANRALYETYRERADQINNLLICGRLGEYRYFDMDQAIARAQVLARRLLVV
jgi:UDP-galactopyranose mutase